MENFSRPVRRDGERFELPPGFRFHPTDEELIICYLSEKVLDSSFTAIAVGEADLNKCEPWDLPWRAKWGEEEWYFFSVRDRKYPMGQRANRATEAGYWKATGKDKEVFREKTVIGMKKTLVFYKGRAPEGERTNWVMHEYRLQAGPNGFPTNIQPQNLKSEWVLCRVFQKNNNGGKKLNIPPPPPSSSLHHLPPLTDASPLTTSTTTDTATAQAEFGDQSSHDGVHVDVDISETNPLIFPSSSSSNPTDPYSYQSTSATPLMVPLPQLVNPQYPDGLLSQDQILMRMLMENNDGYSNTIWPSLKAYDQTQFSGDTQFLGSDMNLTSSTLYNNNVGNMNMLQSQTTSFAQNPEYSSASAGNDLDFGTFWNF